jgi:hypothetical protein
MSDPLPLTGVYQFPQNKCVCTTCGFMCWVEQKAYPTTTSPVRVVVSHPTHPTCPFSHRAFEVPMTRCEELPAEWFSEHIA